MSGVRCVCVCRANRLSVSLIIFCHNREMYQHQMNFAMERRLFHGLQSWVFELFWMEWNRFSRYDGSIIGTEASSVRGMHEFVRMSDERNISSVRRHIHFAATHLNHCFAAMEHTYLRIINSIEMTHGMDAWRLSSKPSIWRATRTAYGNRPIRMTQADRWERRVERKQ